MWDRRQVLFRAFKVVRHGPGPDIFDSKERYLVVRELDRFFQEFSDMSDFEVERPRPKRPSVRVIKADGSN